MMNPGIRINQLVNGIADRTAFISSLLLRLYLAPVFWIAGTNKLASFDSTVEWFGNPDWGLGLPMPWLMAFLATATEVIGAILLLLGLGTRYVTLPLMITMLVAAFTVHWQNGWQAVADSASAFASDKLGFLQLEDASGRVFADKHLELPDASVELLLATLRQRFGGGKIGERQPQLDGRPEPLLEARADLVGRLREALGASSGEGELLDRFDDPEP